MDKIVISACGHHVTIDKAGGEHHFPVGDGLTVPCDSVGNAAPVVKVCDICESELGADVGDIEVCKSCQLL